MDAKGYMPDVVRRRGIRRKYEELSKYYELGGTQISWATTKLLSRGKCENDRGVSCRFAYLGSLAVLKEVSKPPEPSREPPSQGSTWARVREDTRPIPRTVRGRAKRNSTIHRIDESGDNLEDTGEDGDEGSVWERKKDSNSDSDSDSELER